MRYGYPVNEYPLLVGVGEEFHSTFTVLTSEPFLVTK